MAANGGVDRTENLLIEQGGETAAAGCSPGSHQTPLWVLKATQFLGTAAWACLARFITVYFSEIGISRDRIGVLQCAGPVVSFTGQLFWSAVIDHLGSYRSVLVCTSIAGTVVVFANLLSPVQDSFWLVLLVTVLWNFLLCTGGPIVDAMCLQVLSDQNITEEGYGDQRLWCALGWGGMSLVAGQMIDVFGISFMFVGFACIQAVNIWICVTWLPPPKQRASNGDNEGEQTVPFARILFTFDVLWFLANLLVYGVTMSLVETFLLVFLLQDFDNTPKLLLGSAVAVMCAFEVPVFKYAERLWTQYNSSLTTVLVGCHATLAIRCWLYTLLPPAYPWLVLLIEPLHGVTFAAMWAASVEYGKRLAPAGGMARMQALVNGLYYQAAMGLGSILWGALVRRPPEGIGFFRCFWLDMALIVGWCTVWRLGVFWRSRYGQRRIAGNASSPDAVDARTVS